MTWFEALSYFLGGGLLTNAVPHFVSGVCGRPFQSPFASPPGQGHSSSVVNVLWGFANMVAAWFLILRVGSFDLGEAGHALAFAAGILFTAVFLARYLGRFHGGNLSGAASADT